MQEAKERAYFQGGEDHLLEYDHGADVVTVEEGEGELAPASWGELQTHSKVKRVDIRTQTFSVVVEE